LKSHFMSYWKSRYSVNASPIQMWSDDETMKKIIKYRIGINNSDEIFNFSLHQLVRGISARRACISFFKPQLAANIYNHFLTGISNPSVIDPCAGFGGRLLGFKSIFPNGKYIGIEPNPETYAELQTLAKEFTNVELHNCKLEEYTGNKDCDLTFTSVPYFGTEIYSDGLIQTEANWKRMMHTLTESYKNILLNISEASYNSYPFQYEEKYLLENNVSHFSKNKDKKHEYILKCY